LDYEDPESFMKNLKMGKEQLDLYEYTMDGGDDPKGAKALFR